MRSTLIDPTTYATLLLCGVMPGSKDASAAAFSAGDYHRLRRALAEREVELAALVDQREELLDLLSGAGWDRERLSRLLARDADYDALLERWLAADLWIISYEHKDYPARLRERLSDAAPPLLFGIGSRAPLTGGGIAMVGSRNADAEALTFTAHFATLCAEQNITVISGGARGVDQAAMLACLDANGFTVGLLADSLGREAGSEKYSAHLDRRHLCLASPVSPEAPFSVGNAMARNKLIYALSDAALVISADAETGGTWNGAIENLKYKWSPLWVRIDATAPRGNALLLRRGARALEAAQLDAGMNLRMLMAASADGGDLTLFGNS